MEVGLGINLGDKNPSLDSAQLPPTGEGPKKGGLNFAHCKYPLSAGHSCLGIQQCNNAVKIIIEQCLWEVRQNNPQAELYLCSMEHETSDSSWIMTIPDLRDEQL